MVSGIDEEQARDNTNVELVGVAENANAPDERHIVEVIASTDSEGSPLKPRKPSRRSHAHDEQPPWCSPKYVLPFAGILITLLTLFIFSIHGWAAMTETPENNGNARLFTFSGGASDVNANVSRAAATAQSFFGKTTYHFGTVTHGRDNDAEQTYTMNAEEFLIACKDYLVIYELLGGATFKMITSDVNGNINKLGKARQATGENNLFAILQREIDAGTTAKSGSSTDALLWLKRGLWMMYYFFSEIVETEGKTTASAAFNKAYTLTLSAHHNFAVRFAISTGLSMAPSLDKFINAVCSYQVKGDLNAEHSCMKTTNDPERRTQIVMSEIAVYIKDMRNLLELIDDFYKEKLPQLKK